MDVEEPQNLSLHYILMCIDIIKATSEREALTIKMKNCHPQSQLLTQELEISGESVNNASYNFVFFFITMTLVCNF